MKNKETKKIRDCYSELKHAFDPVSYHKHVDRALDISIEESKRHDQFRSDSIGRGISVQTEAKYFVIKRLAEYMNINATPPNVADYLSIQRSCFACFALTHSSETREYALKWWDKNIELISEITSWDYSDLIKTENRRKFAHSEFHQNNLENKSI